MYLWPSRVSDCRARKNTSEVFLTWNLNHVDLASRFEIEIFQPGPWHQWVLFMWKRLYEIGVPKGIFSWLDMSAVSAGWLLRRSKDWVLTSIHSTNGYPFNEVGCFPCTFSNELITAFCRDYKSQVRKTFYAAWEYWCSYQESKCLVCYCSCPKFD